jgi:hypothetical protein
MQKSPNSLILLRLDNNQQTLIIDPEKKYAGVELNRYKFCTKLNRSVLKSTKDLQSLFDTLITAYSGNRGDHGLQQTWKTAA